MAEITANLPVGIEPTLVADQAVTVDVAIDEFMASLWQAIAIILACSFVSLGVRPGSVVALAIPLTLAIVFAIMDIVGIDLQRISLGALIIALALLVDDAMTTIDAMINRLAAGDTRTRRRPSPTRTLAAPMLTGTLVTIAGFVPIGFAQQLRGRVHLLDLRRGRHRADRLVAGRGDLRAAARHGDPQGAQAESRRQAEQARDALYRALPERGDARAMADHRLDARRLRRVDLPGAASCRGSSSRPPTGPSCWST